MLDPSELNLRGFQVFVWEADPFSSSVFPGEQSPGEAAAVMSCIQWLLSACGNYLPTEIFRNGLGKSGLLNS